MAHHLAQINIGRLLAPIDDPIIADFKNQLDDINALAESSPGFIWRLTGEGNNATDLHPFGDELMIVNMSVWTSVEALRAFVYKSAHTVVMRRRDEWFAKFSTKFPTAYLALWWVDEGHEPTVDEARERLRSLDETGPSPFVFTFRHLFPPLVVS